MSQTYTPVPDQTPGGPKYGREKELFDWLRLNCQWREGEWCDTQPLLEGFASWEKAQFGMPVSGRSIAQSLTALGYRVEGAKVLGILLRGKDAVPTPEKPVDEQSLRGGSAAPVNPDLYAANGVLMEIPKKPEVTFIENGPQPRPKFIQDATGKWIVDKLGDAK
jgi:hypothetical protein